MGATQGKTGSVSYTDENDAKLFIYAACRLTQSDKKNSVSLNLCT